MCIIGVSGKARVGKNTFAEMLAEELHRRTGQAYVLMAYADELKKMAQKELDLSWEQLWGNEKEACDSRFPKPQYLSQEINGLVQIHWTGREIMQELGEFFRKFDNDFWVKRLFRIIDENDYRNVILTDVRYPNEVDRVIERCVDHVRINRPLPENIVHGPTHASEISLDAPYKVDFTVMNTGTLDDLRKLASDIANGITQLEKFRR